MAQCNKAHMAITSGGKIVLKIMWDKQNLKRKRRSAIDKGNV